MKYLYIRLSSSKFILFQCTVPSLQKLCDILGEHKSWTVAHIVAHFGQYELLNEPDVQKQINEVDPATGSTALMVNINNYLIIYHP